MPRPRRACLATPTSVFSRLFSVFAPSLPRLFLSKNIPGVWGQRPQLNLRLGAAPPVKPASGGSAARALITARGRRVTARGRRVTARLINTPKSRFAGARVVHTLCTLFTPPESAPLTFLCAPRLPAAQPAPKGRPPRPPRPLCPRLTPQQRSGKPAPAAPKSD